MKRLSKTGIEYGDLSWNFFPGCLHKPQGKCPLPNCWAEAMSKRQQADFHKPHLIPELLLAPLHVKKPSTILVNFMGDLMGDWVDPEQHVLIEEGYNTLRQYVFMVIRARPEHRFLFLTKNPENYAKWGEWPDNAWLGASAWDACSFTKACNYLGKVAAKHKWLSLEPLLKPVVDTGTDQFMKVKGIEWVVIGGQTRPTIMPKIEWVEEIVRACDAAGVKVWLKENIRSVMGNAEHPLKDCFEMRQETPWVPSAGNV